MSKKKKIILIAIAALLLLVLMIIMTVLALNARESEKVEKREATKDVLTITCVKENAHDDVTETETVYLEKGILITRTDNDTWTKREPSQKTCDYYNSKNTGLNTKEGVSSRVDCNETRGNFTATYTIANVDKEDTQLKQFDYINQDNIFDYRSWKSYMEKDGFKCQES